MFIKMIFNLLLIILLLLGTLNPVKGNKVDEFIAYFLFGLVSIIVFSPNKFKKLKKLAIWVVIICFLVSSVATSKDLRNMLSSDLPLYTYNNDPGVFLKTYQLVKGGENYYSAFFIAQNGTFTGKRIPSDIWWFRMPTIFYLWSFLPGSGLSIYLLFLLLASVCLFAAYKIVLKFCGFRIALMSPYLLFGYLHFGARDQMLLETEWWGVMFFIIGLYFFFYKRFFWAIVLFSLAVLTRELYVISLVFMFLASFANKRRRVWVFIIPILSFALLFVFHILAVTKYFSSFVEMFRPRLAGDGLFLVKQTLVFGSWEYLFFFLKPFYFFVFFALIGSYYIFRKIDKGWGLCVLASFIVFPIAFLKVGSVPFNDYWGIMYIPQVLIFAPLVLGIFKHKLSTKV